MNITIINNCEPCDVSRPVTFADLLALENRIMSVLSDKIAALTASLEELKTRVEAAVPAQADLDALDAAKTTVDAIAPNAAVPPVEPPVEPTA